MPRRMTDHPRLPPPQLLPPPAGPVQEAGSTQETPAAGASHDAAAVAGVSWGSMMAPRLRALLPAIRRWSALVAGLLSAGDAWARRVVAALRHLLAPRLDRQAAGAENRAPKAKARKNRPNPRQRAQRARQPRRQVPSAEVPALTSSPSSPRVARTGPAASFLGNLPPGALFTADAAQGAPPEGRVSKDAAQPQDGSEGGSSHASTTKADAPGVQVGHSHSELVVEAPTAAPGPNAADAIQSLAPQDCGEASLVGGMPALVATHPVPGANKEAVAKKAELGAKKLASVAKNAVTVANNTDGTRNGAPAQLIEDEDCCCKDVLYVDEAVDPEQEAHRKYVKKASTWRNEFTICIICHLKGDETEMRADNDVIIKHCLRAHQGKGFKCKKEGCLARAKTRHDIGLHEIECLRVRQRKC